MELIWRVLVTICFWVEYSDLLQIGEVWQSELRNSNVISFGVGRGMSLSSTWSCGIRYALLSTGGLGIRNLRVFSWALLGKW